MHVETETAWRRALVRWHDRWSYPGLVPKLFVAFWLLYVASLVLLFHGG